MYQWQRYLCARDLSYELDRNGFLVEPTPLHVIRLNPNLILPEQILELPCAALLGEMGIGKSTVLHNLYLSIANAPHAIQQPLWIELGTSGTAFEIARALFDSNNFQAWKNSSEQLYLFLDGLDEGLLLNPTLPELLIRELKSCPIARLSLFITCRSGAWRFSFEDALKDLWEVKSLPVFELAPLRQVDVEEAARANRIDPQQFVREVIEREIGPLATQPLTLDDLVILYKLNGTLPRDLTRYTLYEQSILRLCSEHIERRRQSRATRLTPEQLRFVTARIAAAMIFCNRSTIWIEPAQSPTPTQDVTFQELRGTLPTGLNVGDNELLEALSTGLFSQREGHRFGWVHQSYTEFLAAYYLIEFDTLPEEILEILRVKGELALTIAPQLYDTAAWLSMASSQVSDILLYCAPEILLRIDKSLLNDASKQILVQTLLKQAEQGYFFDTYLTWHTYHKLNFNGLNWLLEPYLRSKGYSQDARMLAIRIAEECNVTNLSGLLAALALDTTESLPLREAAAFAVAQLGDDAAIVQLRPLANGLEEDVNDELKGIALKALWSRFLSTPELVNLLTAPKRQSLIGVYSGFIRHNIANQLSEPDFLTVLQWVGTWQEGRNDIFDDLEDKIVSLSWKYAENPQILELLAGLVVSRLVRHQRVFPRDKEEEQEWQTERLDSQRRTLVKNVMLKFLASDSNAVRWAFQIRRNNLLNFRDVEWMLDEYSASVDPAYRHLLAQLLRLIWESTDIRQIEQLYIVASETQLMTVVMSDYFGVIELNSQLADQAREEYAQSIDVHDVPETVIDLQTEQRVNDLLNRAQLEGTHWWVSIDEILMEEISPNGQSISQLHYYPSPNESPGWLKLSENARNRVIEVAEKYVEHYKPTDDWALIAGFRAFWLLVEQGKLEKIEDLDSKTWSKWVLALLDYPYIYGNDNSSVRSLLLGLAYSASPDEVITQLVSNVRSYADEAKGARPRNILESIQLIWDDRLRHTLEQEAQRSEISLIALEAILEILIRQRSERAKSFAVRLVRQILADSSVEERALVAGRALFLHGEWIDLDQLLSTFQDQQDFGKKVLLSVAYELDGYRENFYSSGSESQMEGWITWLFEQFPPNEDPQHDGVFSPTARDHIARVRDRLLNSLVRRGTPESIASVKRLARNFSNDNKDWTRTLRETEKVAWRKIWQPFDPQQLLKKVNTAYDASIKSRRSIPSPPSSTILLGVLWLVGVLFNLIGFTADLWSIWDNICEPNIGRPVCEFFKDNMTSLAAILIMLSLWVVADYLINTANIKDKLIGFKDCQIGAPRYEQKYPKWVIAVSRVVFWLAILIIFAILCLTGSGWL